MQALLYRLFGNLPTDWASNLGSFIVRRNVPITRPGIIVNAKANLRRHRPDASEAELDTMVRDFLDGVGRVMAEFAVMHRFLREGRVAMEGLEAFRAVVGTRPLIAFGLHTGNWEVFGPAFQHLGIPLASFYAPPEDDFERRIAEQSRGRFGVSLLSPDPGGAREGLRLLRQNRVVMIFPDEARRGRLMAPLFGRRPHDAGNLAIAARLARHTGAGFVICHSERTAPCRFRLNFGPVFDLPEMTGKPDILADVAFLNACIEPIIACQVPRWYFLDDSLAEIAP